MVQADDLALLQGLGWSADFAESLAVQAGPRLSPARVAADHGARFLVYGAGGPAQASLSRALLEAGRRVAVGDWVGLRSLDGRPQIWAVLPRRSAIQRKVPDVEVREQVLAANVDVVFITSGLDADLNLRRIERLLTVVYQSGAAPALLLTKSDLGAPEASRARVEAIAPGVPVLVLSSLTGEGVDAVGRYLGPGMTGVLLGPSGVGKSTLINRLLGGDPLRTAEVHRSGQGRHTTSHRELFRLPGGGVLIDTPGLREIQLWAGGEALDQVFGDIEEIVLRCRFSNCRHDSEPGCAVVAALDGGILEPGRWASYRKLQRELRSIEVRADARLRSEERRRWSVVHKEVRRNLAARGRQ